MKTMRTVAADLRRDAMAGLSADDRERFVDLLIAVKGNLQRQENGGRNGARGR